MTEAEEERGINSAAWWILLGEDQRGHTAEGAHASDAVVTLAKRRMAELADARKKRDELDVLLCKKFADDVAASRVTAALRVELAATREQLQAALVQRV